MNGSLRLREQAGLQEAYITDALMQLLLVEDHSVGYHKPLNCEEQPNMQARRR